MCVSFFCRLVESKDKNWTFSWFQVRNEFWLLTTSIQRMKIDEKKKNNTQIQQKSWKFWLKNCVLRLMTKVVQKSFSVRKLWSVLHSWRNFSSLSHQSSAQKKVFHFFWVSYFSLKIGRFILRQRLRRPSCVHSAFRKWIQQVWQRNVIFVFINLFHTTNSKSEFRIKPANVKCRVFIELFMQVFQKVEPIESCKRVT